MKTRVVIALAVISALAPLYGGGRTEAPDQPSQTIAVVARILDDPLYADARRAAEAAAHELETPLLWTAPLRAEAAEQISIVEQMIETGVAAILISPLDAAALRAVIDRAVGAGTAVATFELDVPQSRRLFYVGTSQRRIGEVAAEQLLQLTHEMRAPVDVAILTGIRSSFTLDERLIGAQQTLAQTNVRIVNKVQVPTEPQQAADAVASYSDLYPGLDGWLILQGYPLLGDPLYSGGLRQFRDRGGVVVAADSFYPMLQAVSGGSVDVLVGIDMATLADRAVRELIEVLRGGEVPARAQMLEPEVVNRGTLPLIQGRKAPW